ncbi:MAG: cytochrome c [Nitrospirota bacterium]|nr:cytochrome c [Nitrospirota bacterium]
MTRLYQMMSAFNHCTPVLKFIMLLFVLVVFNGCTSSTGQQESTPIQQTDSAQVRQLFMAKCAICHGEDGKLGIANSKDLSVSQLSKDEVIAMIRYGKTTMPPQPALSDEQIESLAEYTLRLRPQ